MDRLVHVKDLKNRNLTMLELMKSYIFGDKKIEIYDEDKIYNKGDIIVSYNPSTGKTEVIQAKEDNITGPFDETKWENTSIINTVGAGKIDNMIIIDSEDKSTDDTRVWFQIQGMKDFHPGYDLIPYDHYSANMSEDLFPIEEIGKAPEEDVKMYFTAIEKEASDQYIKPGIKPEKLEISSQDNIHVQNTTPPESTTIWIKRKERSKK